MSNQRRIAIVTGTRAEFGLFEPVLRALRVRTSLTTHLIATGMHLLPKFGYTIDHIRAAGWKVDATVPMQTGQDRRADESAALARGIAGIGAALRRLRSDIVVVLGDRIEAFAGACAAVTSRRVLAHIHSGDRATGELDDSLRNAISRMAHMHLAASREAVARLRLMGESPERIFLVGAPGLDDIGELKRRERGESRAGRSGAPYAVIAQHPIGRSRDEEAAAMNRVLRAVRAAGLAGTIIYPNSDPGHEGIMEAIRQWPRLPGWRVFRSLPREDYLRLVRGSALMVGNSSGGLIESASLGVNAVDVGDRQAGRLRCGPGVIHATEDESRILKAIRTALSRPRPRAARSAYGDGRAGERIAAVLEKIKITAEFRRKTLYY